MKIVTIVGARPQFIKAAAVSRAIMEHNITNNGLSINEIIVHTGQHYDKNMSAVFFEQLDIPKPEFNLGITSPTHGAMTGRMLEEIEKVLLEIKPDILLIYGDTNSTLAGALAAAKLNIPVAHVEAGLRSFNMSMPEEINRILTDRVSSLLFCPTTMAIENLKNEGITKGVYNVGDVMYDIALYYKEMALKQFPLDRWSLTEKNYVLCTIHRAENTDNPERLIDIFYALQKIAIDITVILPLHPRTEKILEKIRKKNLLDNLLVIEPTSFLEMMRLEISAKVILTDSGGVQKEAFFHKVPCLTLRDETEWVETVEVGWNHLCGANKKKILTKWEDTTQQDKSELKKPYGNGQAAKRIVKLLLNIKSGEL